jgi:hypothetical protein
MPPCCLKALGLDHPQKATLANLKHARTRKFLGRIMQRFAIQAHRFLVKHTATSTPTGNQPSSDQNVQHGMPGLQAVNGHVIRDITLLEDAHEFLLGALGIRFGMVNGNDFILTSRG